MAAIKQFLDLKFKIKDLGRYFLGLEIYKIPQGLAIVQRKFIHELLEEFSCIDLSPVAAPLDLNHKLSADVGNAFADPTRYGALIGQLNFLVNTRPDLAFAV